MISFTTAFLFILAAVGLGLLVGWIIWGDLVMNLAREAVKAWPRHPLATRQQTNALRRGYIKARVWLGDKWLLAVPVKRKQEH